MPAGALICQESSGNTSGRRVAACAGTAECNYTPVRKPTPRSKRSSSLQPTTYILESMAVEVARTKCRRASTAIRTRVHGVSKNFGSGCEPEYLTIASHSAIKRWGAGRCAMEVSFSISSLPGFANRVSRSAIGDRAPRMETATVPVSPEMRPGREVDIRYRIIARVPH
jgi:hypothetical protein